MLHKGRNSETLKYHTNYEGDDLCFSLSASLRASQTSGDKPDAVPAARNRINKCLEGQ